MASDAKNAYKLQHDIQKTHVTILDKAGKDDFNYASALKAQLNFDKIARKFLLKYDCEAKLMKLGAGAKLNKEEFAKVFEKEFIPEFSDKVFDIIYTFNQKKGRKKKKGKKQDKNLLSVGGNNAAAAADDNNDASDEKEKAQENDGASGGDDKDKDKEKEKEKEEIRVISRLDCQRFIKSAKEVRKHIREKSLVPLSSIFNTTQFSDISDSVGKVSYEEFQGVFEKKLGKQQCQQAFDLMKDDKGQISIVAYNNFRDKGVQKLLGDDGKDDDADGDDEAQQQE